MPRPMLRMVALGSLGFVMGCSGAPETSEVTGSCADAYGAEVCTWATVADGQVVSVGATVPLASIEEAPAEVPMPWPPPVTAALNLPQTATQATGLTHMTMYWEPMGHSPADGQPIFVEPMISRAFLLKRASFDLTVPVIPGMPGAPATFRAEYDGAGDAYRFEFGFPRAD